MSFKQTDSGVFPYRLSGRHSRPSVIARAYSTRPAATRLPYAFVKTSHSRSYLYSDQSALLRHRTPFLVVLNAGSTARIDNDDDRAVLEQLESVSEPNRQFKRVGINESLQSYHPRTSRIDINSYCTESANPTTSSCHFFNYVYEIFPTIVDFVIPSTNEYETSSSHSYCTTTTSSFATLTST